MTCSNSILKRDGVAVLSSNVRNYFLKVILLNFLFIVLSQPLFPRNGLEDIESLSIRLQQAMVQEDRPNISFYGLQIGNMLINAEITETKAQPEFKGTKLGYGPHDLDEIRSCNYGFRLAKKGEAERLKKVIEVLALSGAALPQAKPMSQVDVDIIAHRAAVTHLYTQMKSPAYTSPLKEFTEATTPRHTYFTESAYNGVVSIRRDYDISSVKRLTMPKWVNVWREFSGSYAEGIGSIILHPSKASILQHPGVLRSLATFSTVFLGTPTKVKPNNTLISSLDIIAMLNAIGDVAHQKERQNFKNFLRGLGIEAPVGFFKDLSNYLISAGLVESYRAFSSADPLEDKVRKHFVQNAGVDVWDGIARQDQGMLVQCINDIVFKKTRGLIPGLVGKSDVSSGRAFSTVYFKGLWEDSFRYEISGDFTRADGSKEKITFLKDIIGLKNVSGNEGKGDETILSLSLENGA